MNKKVLYLILAIIVIIVLAIVGYYFFGNNSNSSSNTNNDITTNENQNTDNNTNVTTGEGNILVVYYSAQGHTEEVANQIANNLEADVFTIEPVDDYTSDDLDWTDSNSRVSREHEDESLRDIELTTTTVPNWDDYDTVLIGYPIWWGIAAWPVDSFVTANDFTNKTVIPFCTSSSSSIGDSGERLADEAGTGSWQEGYRFSSNPSSEEIREWTDSLGL